MEAEHRADPFARYRAIGTVAGLLILLLGAKEVFQNFLHPGCRDFINFWSAAHLALAGTPALAYHPQALHDLENSIVVISPATQMPFAYIPAFVLVVLPFGLLPYPAAMALWVALTLLLYFIALKRLAPRAGLLAFAFPPMLVTIALGQNGFFTAALFVAAIANLERRPWVAGLLAGCLVLKPQLGLFFPVALVASGNWRAFAGAAVSAICVCLSGLLAFGTGTMVAWANQLPLLAAVARDGLVGWSELASVYAAARQAGLGAAPAMAIHSSVALLAAALVWRAWRSKQDYFAKSAILASATGLASPYLFLYDLPILIVPLLWLARSRVHPALLALPWCVSAVAIAQHFWGVGSINLNPLIAICLLVFTAWQQRKSAAEPPLSTNAEPIPELA